MKQLFYKYLFILINKSSIMVGGQAVIEGVMMRVPGAYATAVRDPHGIIQINYNKHISIVEKYKLIQVPILRGFLHLIDSMKIGYKTLDWSSKISEADNQKTNQYIDIFLSLMSILFAIFLFMGIPYYLTDLFFSTNDNILFNIFAGSLRIFIFILYLLILSQLKDVKRLFQYHGAEHKVVFNFESGKKITILNAQQFSTYHPRCGTSFMFIIMIVTIVTYSFIDSTLVNIFDFNFNVFMRIGLHLLCLPFVAGLGYEVLKFLSRHQTNIVFYILSSPGLWLQRITTKNPTDSQIEVSIAALNAAFNNDLFKFEGKKHVAEAIG